MKANNFMVGDWVLNDEGVPFRVAQVTDALYDGYISNLMLENGEEYEDKEVKPVPLTPDILQKIGLRQLVVNGKEYYVMPVVGYYNLTPEQRLHQSSCVYSPSKDHTCGWLFINADEGRIEVICDYVHQVQRQFKYIGWDSDFKLNQ